jgi:hypothetical protein
VPHVCVQLQDHLEGPLGMVLYEYSDGKLGPASMEVRRPGTCTMCTALPTPVPAH